MPWHRKTMKDVITCDKLRGVGYELRSVDFRMGEPNTLYRVLHITEFIGYMRQPRELKHLST